MPTPSDFNLTAAEAYRLRLKQEFDQADALRESVEAILQKRRWRVFEQWVKKANDADRD